MTHDAEPVAVDIAPDLRITVLVQPDADAVLDAAVRDPAVDPYAHLLWPAAIAAAQVLAARISPGDVVLDVGAGTGLCALSAAAAGATAFALDRDADALSRIERAAALNAVHVGCIRFDITAPVPLPFCTIALFADLLYEPALANAVACRVTELRKNGCLVIIADPGRAGRNDLVAVLAEHGIAVEWQDIVVEPPGDVTATVQVAILG